LHYASLEISVDALDLNVPVAERDESVEGLTVHQFVEQHVRTLGFISRAIRYAATTQQMMEVN
jgi:hypothetical protein